MATVMRRRVALGVAALVLAGVAALCLGPVQAADGSDALRRENAELRQILQHFGRDAVDVYLSADALRAGTPEMAQVLPLRPASVFGTPFFRFRDEAERIYFVAPGEICAIRTAPRPAGRN
jgi:hypothetical protein